MNPKHVASITAESTFGAQMIDARTELLFIDEWAADKKQFDQCKMVFQGGSQVIPLKGRLPASFKFLSGVYLTINEVKLYASFYLHIVF